MKPWAVVDFSWLRARSISVASNRCRYVFPDGIYSEIVNCDKPRQMGTKFARFVQDNRDNVFIGMSCHRIIEKELETGRPVGTGDVIDAETSRRIVRCLDDRDYEAWRLAVDAMKVSEINRSNEDKRNHFASSCVAFGQWAKSLNPAIAEQLTDPDAFAFWLRDPELASRSAAHIYPECSGLEWQAKLCCFPDQFAVGRWMRVLARSHCRALLGRTKGIQNDWDDAQYAFLTSYSLRLLTLDKDLAQAVRQLFPGSIAGPSWSEMS